MQNRGLYNNRRDEHININRSDIINSTCSIILPRLSNLQSYSFRVRFTSNEDGVEQGYDAGGLRK
jgi:hypothetical protein